MIAADYPDEVVLYGVVNLSTGEKFKTKSGRILWADRKSARRAWERENGDFISSSGWSVDEIDFVKKE